LSIIEREELADRLELQWKDRHPAFMKIPDMIRKGSSEGERLLAYQRACELEIAELRELLV
jgi:hypothetical protein